MLPKKSRPPARVIPAHDCTSPGRPNAHFNFSFGTSAAESPAAGAAWKRVFDAFCPKPFHVDAAGVIAKVPRPVVHIAFCAGAIENGVPKPRPLANSAIARRSAAVRSCVDRHHRTGLHRVEDPLRPHRPQRLA
jgi:hypothetical protein